LSSSSVFRVVRAKFPPLALSFLHPSRPSRSSSEDDDEDEDEHEEEDDDEHERRRRMRRDARHAENRLRTRKEQCVLFKVDGLMPRPSRSRSSPQLVLVLVLVLLLLVVVVVLVLVCFSGGTSEIPATCFVLPAS
jgi:hypothetical protein